ncbi:RNA polymerase sigma factor [Persicimonas caeni]|uniref:RNA polymerase sigma factor n=1 Tax=Persicimonas caeni TaxID=2292766 RepID=UPI00143D1584|nr:sigma-70 family RNA polymerase sigma factor [Persicimonas caeni]
MLESEENIEAFRRGDRDLLGDVYRHYVSDVERMLRGGFTFTSQGETVRFRGITQPFRLQEVIQESFIHTFRDKARQAYDPAREFRPYLLTIVRNLVIDRYRRRKLESQLFVHLGDMAYADEDEREVLGRLSGNEAQQGDPEESAWQSQLGVVLGEFLAALDDVDSRILEEHLLGSQTQQGMADELGMSRNDVRKRIRELRARLLRHLKSEGVIGNLEVADVMRAVTTLIALGVVG